MADRTLWIDVTDLVRHQGASTGIQRVVAGFAAGFRAVDGGLPLRFCRFLPERGFLALEEEAALTLLAGRAAGPAPRARGPWRRLAERLGHGRVQTGEAPFAPGDLLLDTGLYTYKEPAQPLVARILEDRGVRLVGFVHDTMHADFPEWWSLREQARVVGWYRFVARHAALLLCASEATRADTARFLAREDLPAPPLVATGLAGTLAPAGSPPPPPVAGPYALYVSTLEVRKNHRLLLEVWRRLRARLGAELPTLVFLGKRGHLVDDLFAMLDNGRWLDGKVRWLEGQDDRTLVALYAGCRFTLYPSLYEGWGLPVAESLAFGKYGIASAAGALPEVGGPFLDYHDPYDAPTATALIERAIRDPAHVAAREALIRRSHTARTWPDCAAAALAALRSLPV